VLPAPVPFSGVSILSDNATKLTDSAPSGQRIRGRSRLKFIPRKLPSKALDGRSVTIARTFTDSDGTEYQPGEKPSKELLAHEFLGGYFRRGYLVASPPLDARRNRPAPLKGTRAQRLVPLNAKLIADAAKAVGLQADDLQSYISGHSAGDPLKCGLLDRTELAGAAIALSSGARRAKAKAAAKPTTFAEPTTGELSRNNTKAEIQSALKEAGIDFPSDASKGELLKLHSGGA